jgi:hypothetical protein
VLPVVVVGFVGVEVDFAEESGVKKGWLVGDAGMEGQGDGLFLVVL